MTSTPPPTLEAAAVSADATPASTPSAPSDRFSDCVMLRFLSRDFGSQCAVLALLFTTEIALLIRSCRTWSRWIHEPNVLGYRCREVKPSRFPEYLACGWIRLPQRMIFLLPEIERLDNAPDASLEMQTRQSTERQQMEFALAHVGPAFFPRIEELILWIRVPRISDSVLRDCFASLAPRLRTLECVLPSSEHAVKSDTTAHSLMAHVSLLPRMRSLRLFGAISDPESVSFAALPNLTELDDFIFRVCADSDVRSVVWHPTRTQVECLTRCAQLTELECGSWADDTLAMLARAKRPSISAPHQTLQSLDLHETVITAPLWSHLAQLNELDNLTNAGWSDDPSAEEWVPLASFRRLTSLWLSPDVVSGLIELSSANYLPALVQCTSLERLVLGSTTLSAAQMQLVARSLHKLTLLHLVSVRLPLESLACLASLPLDTALFDCTPLEGAFATVRPHLPALASLTKLTLWDPEEHRLPAAAVADLNAALLARCPKLQPSEFRQNLL